MRSFDRLRGKVLHPSLLTKTKTNSHGFTSFSLVGETSFDPLEGQTGDTGDIFNSGNILDSGGENS